MKEKRGMVLKYTAKGKTISRSAHHPGLWIIDYDGGGFSTINTTQEDMLRMNPPDHIMIKEVPWRH